MKVQIPLKEKDSREQLENVIDTIVNASNDVMYVYDLELRKNIYVNGGLQKNLGYSTEEIESMGENLLSNLMHPDDYDYYLKNIYPGYFALKEKEIIEKDYRMRSKSGEWIWLHSRESVFNRKEDGIPCQIFGLSEDITYRKEAEEKLIKNEARLRKAQKIGQLGYWQRDIDGDYLWGTSEAMKIFGFPLSEGVIPIEQVIPCIPDIDKAFKAGSELINMGKKYEIEMPIFPVDGSPPKTIKLTAELEKDEHDVPQRIVGIVQDITARKIAEKTLLESEEKMRALAGHLQSVREDERKSIARDLHDDLGQVLTSLKMNIALAKRELEDRLTKNKKKKLLDDLQSMNITIDKSVNRVRKIITNLRPELLDKLGLIAALEWYVEEFRKESKILCLFETNVNELTLSHDVELAIFRIVQETVNNSVKHSGAGSVKISLNAEAGKLILEVKDDGKGITDEELKGGKSFGLLGMMERSHLIGGILKVSGEKGKGTSVKLEVSF